MAVEKVLLYGVYVTVSFYVFLQVYETSLMVIDEEFHLRQGMHYCNGDFGEWDPKITTFPGLYLVSTALFFPFGACNTFTLRLVSLLASIANVFLIYEIRKLVLGQQRPHNGRLEFEALTIAILPPLYFFAHLYYTDVISLTTVLGLMLFNLKNEHNVAALFGLASVIMRQTNIVWVGMALGTTVIDKFVLQTLPFIKGNEKYGKSEHIYTFKDILSVLGFYYKRVYLIPKQIKLLASYLIGYIVVLLMFVVFVFLNGSIVVGDKSAHEAALHFPQILYFALFTLIFGVSLIISNFCETFKTLYRRWLLVLTATIVFAAVVHLNTIVHPYLLADNRHYTFYVWNKFYGRYFWAPYAIIPAYVFALVAACHSVSDRSAGFRLTFAVCATAALAFQQLIEVRYFLIPFLVLRLHQNATQLRHQLPEFALYLLINISVFYTFCTKEIYWDDFESVQRLIW